MQPFGSRQGRVFSSIPTFEGKSFTISHHAQSITKSEYTRHHHHHHGISRYVRIYFSNFYLSIMVVLTFQQPQNPSLHCRAPPCPQAHNLVSHPKGQGGHCPCPRAASPSTCLQIPHHPLRLRRPRPPFHPALLRSRKHLHHNSLAPTNLQRRPIHTPQSRPRSLRAYRGRQHSAA